MIKFWLFILFFSFVFASIHCVNLDEYDALNTEDALWGFRN